MGTAADKFGNPVTRTAILDATEQVMLEEGYAGVSSRKIEIQAGLKSKLLHHYFRTMDDLFIAAFQRREDSHFASFARAASSSRPLHELWKIELDAASSKLVVEYNSMANHRPSIREMISRSASRDRVLVASSLKSIFERYGVDLELYPPMVFATTMAGLARTVATERALGTDVGHAETIAYMERLLARLEPTPS